MQNPLQVKVQPSQKKIKLSLYKKVPEEQELQIDQFEQLAIQRVALFNELESLQLRNATEACALLVKNFKLSPEQDHLSHFICRLIYCRSEDQRAYLLRMETTLFKLRFEQMSPSDREQFISENCTATEWIPFEQVIDLVGRRKVVLQNGMAKIDRSQMFSVVLTQFRSHLQASLELCARMLPRIDEDDRLKPILQDVTSLFTTKQESQFTAGEGMHWSDVEGQSQNFPLCMQMVQNQLVKDKHLKHGARMQYGLFLKGAGLSIEDALYFFKKMFACTDDVFNKQYAYNIRHNYGKEGKRTDYTPYSCMLVIISHVSAGDAHGCPFKHSSPGYLEKMLKDNGLQDTREVLQLAQGNHCQVACTKFFELKYKKESVSMGNQQNVMDTISHPNEYFKLAKEALSAAQAI